MTESRSEPEEDKGVTKLAEVEVLLLLTSLVDDACKRTAAPGNSAFNIMGVGSPTAHKAEEEVPPAQSSMGMHVDMDVLPVAAVVAEAGHATQLDASMAVE